MGKEFKQLEFTDDFMFSKVMQRPEICKPVLELILGIPIRKIIYNETQRSFLGAYDTHGIRLDVYVEDDNNTVFDVEMQSYDDDLPRRSRFYGGMIDRKLLRPGADYSEMKDCYIVFLSTKQMVENGNRCIYTFENRCTEDKEVVLNDGVKKVFVTSAGDDSELSVEMQEFLAYLRNPRKAEKRSSLIRLIEESVLANRMSAEMEEEYMYLEDYGLQQKKIGIKEGIKEGVLEGKRDIVKTMFTSGMSPEEIAKCTKIEISEVNKMLQNK